VRYVEVTLLNDVALFAIIELEDVDISDDPLTRLPAAETVLK
jgi:hypothetical protein